MGKLSKLLLNSFFISAARAETFQVTSCNDENDVSRPPALTFRIAQDHFESNVSEQTDLYTFVDGPDGGYQERTIQQDELSLSFDSETDDILLSYTLAFQPTSGFQLNADTSINFGGDSVVFQCRYARAVSATSQMTVTTPAPGPVTNTGDLTYSMSVDVGALGGDTRITISPNHNLSGLSPRLTSCRVSNGDHEIYPVHSFYYHFNDARVVKNSVCFDNTRLNVEQTVFGETIEFTMKTFRFVSGEASDSADAQEQTISCDLHLEPSADIVQEQALDCPCYTQNGCIDDSVCGAFWPFYRDSAGSKSVIEYLHTNHNYQTRITDDGVLLYKVIETGSSMSFNDARARCDQDSDAAASGDTAVSGFLSLPMPRNDAENYLYYNLVPGNIHAYLDITEVLPQTDPRSWVYRDGSPVTWFNWNSPAEPSNSGGAENWVEIGYHTNNQLWNDAGGDTYHPRKLICTYFLPAGAQNTCTWLNDFED